MPRSKSYRSLKKARTTQSRAVVTTVPAPRFPWHQLPLELQQRVFYFAASRDEGNPSSTRTTLCLVSKAWKNLCFRTPQLWTTVDLSLDDPLESPRRSSLDDLKDILDLKVENATRFLRRAKAVPTTLNLSLTRHRKGLITCGKYEVLLNLLFNARIASNIGLLRITISARLFGTIFRVLALTDDDFPVLNELDIATPDVETMLNHPPVRPAPGLRLNKFPSLKTLKFNVAPENMSNFFGYASIFLPLNQLESISFKSLHQPTGYWNYVLGFLHQCKNVERLHLNMPGWLDNDDSSASTFTQTPITFPRLNNLQIDLQPSHWEEENTTNLNPIIQSITVPSLSDLRITKFGLNYPIPCITRSLLECRERSGFTLRRFVVNGLRFDTPLFLSFLEASEALCKMSMISCDLDISALLRRMIVRNVGSDEELGTTPTRDSTPAPFLPSLEEFEYLKVSNLRTPQPNPITFEELEELLVSRWDTEKSSVYSPPAST